MEESSLYAAAHARICELLADLPDDEFTRGVPATPEWSVGDLLSHLSGAAADHVSGRVAGAGTPEWTAVQVATRRGRPAAAVLDEWRSTLPSLLDVIDARPAGSFAPLVADIACHEHDLRAALDRPGERHNALVDRALQLAVMALGGRLRAAGAPGVRLRAEGTDWEVGDQPVRLTVTADRFTVFRMLFGRRSRAQIGRLDWDADPTPVVHLLPLYPLPAADID